MMIDEDRKLVMVQEIIDSTHFRAAWRGQCYEATAVPDTSSLSVGDSVFCHVMPESTQLVALIPATEVLWFTPGAPFSSLRHEGAWRGELWKCTGLTAEYVLAMPFDGEHITCLWWAFGVLWLASWDVTTTRVYTVNRTAKTVTEVASWITNTPGQYVNPVMDVAIFRNGDDTKQVMYLHCAGADQDPEVYVRVMDQDTYAHTVVFTFPHFAITGGIAVAHEGQTPGGDPGVPVMVHFDGYKVYVTYDAILWSPEEDLYATQRTADAFGLISDTDDGTIYLADQGPNRREKKVLQRTTGGVWTHVLGGISPSTGLAGISLTQQRLGDTPIAIWLQCFGWNWVLDSPEIWSKPVGGGWTQEWLGPCNLTGYSTGWTGIWNQGICTYKGTVYALFYRFDPTPPDSYEVMLFVRVTGGLGIYNWQPVAHEGIDTWFEYTPTTLYAYNLAMCTAPNTFRNPDEV